VEGNHEKNELFWLIFKCFPEINIDMDNVWIYGTNIYLLYEDIAKEYGDDWTKEEMDIDLPFVISKKQTPNDLRYKEDFTNIILVFDYERHDTNFSETKIMGMQNVFMDSTDMGKLYINYPMIESYQHLKSIPDPDYSEKKIPVSLQPGSKYKELVRKESRIGEIVRFPYRIDRLMNEHFGVTNTETRQKCCKDILNISEVDHIEEKLQEIIQRAITDERQKTLKYQLKDWINKLEYANSEQTYWQYVRNLFIEIIYHNICKANRIQNNIYEIQLERYRQCFENLDLKEILNVQNAFSKTSNGFIWVLNTCVFVVADYNFSLVQRKNAN
jgi:hypothetical protein